MYFVYNGYWIFSIITNRLFTSFLNISYNIYILCFFGTEPHSVSVKTKQKNIKKTYWGYVFQPLQ